MKPCMRMGGQKRRWMLALLAATLFIGSFAQLTMLSRLSALGKQAAALERELARMKTEAGSLELCVNQYHNLESIALRAQEMGMEQPDKTQLRAAQLWMGGAVRKDDGA